MGLILCPRRSKLVQVRPGETMRRNWSCCAALALLASCLAANAQGPSSANYDESKAGTFTLPDPLILNNGKPVPTAREWMKRRRAEILELFETNVYGRSPRPPKHIRFNVFDVDNKALEGKAIRKQVTIYFSPEEDKAREDLLIYIPADAPKPVPVILALNFFGNQSVVDDSGIKLATIWDWKTHLQQQAPKQSRGRDREFDVEKILAHGYGFASVCYQDLEPDFQGGYKLGIRPLFFKPGQTEPTPDDGGAIGAVGLWFEPRYGLPREGQGRRSKACGHHGPFSPGQNGALGRRPGHAFCHGALELFGKRRRLTVAPQLRRNAP